MSLLIEKENNLKIPNWHFKFVDNRLWIQHNQLISGLLSSYFISVIFFFILLTDHGYSHNSKNTYLKKKQKSEIITISKQSV